jgi:hypothetical protein
VPLKFTHAFAVPLTTVSIGTVALLWVLSVVALIVDI